MRHARLTCRAATVHRARAAANSAAGFDSPKRRRKSARTMPALFHCPALPGAHLPVQWRAARGAYGLAGALLPVCQPASSVTSFDSGAADSIDTRSPTMNAAHSRAADQQPAATEALSETLRSVAAGPVPANQPNAERQRLREENARYFATHRGMACLLRDLNDDHGRLL